jgi:hypothetical protein
MGKNYSRNRPRAQRPESDFYQTPYCLTEALLNRLSAFFDAYGVRELCDYCAGEGAITRVLERHAFTVKQSDIRGKPPVDFFCIPPGDGFGIMNPPFRLFNKWAEHCFTVFKTGFALLAPTTYLQGISRYNKARTGIFQRKDYPLAGIYTFNRYPMLSAKLRPDGLIETGMQALSWYVWFKADMVDTNATLHGWLDINEYVVRKRRKPV